MTKLRPVQDAVLVELEPEQTLSPAGLTLSATEHHSFRTGVVVAVGPGKTTKKTGKRVPVGVEPGERVVFSSGTYRTKAGEQTRHAVQHAVGADQVLVRGSDILLVVAEGVHVQ
jgi:co-chaperonin GroES (HSP10)